MINVIRPYSFTLLTVAFLLSLSPLAHLWGKRPVEQIIPTTTRKVKNFSKVSFSLPFRLIITQGPSERLTITAPPEYFEEILTVVEAGNLVIRQKGSEWPSHSPLYVTSEKHPVTLRLTVTSLHAFEMHGAGQVKVKHIYSNDFHFSQLGSGSAVLNLHTDSLTVEMKGSGSVEVEDLRTKRCKLEMHGTGTANIHLETDKFIARLTGNTQLDVRGKAVRQQVQLTGAGIVDTLSMSCDHAAVKLTGSGKIQVQALRSFLADLRGEGTIVYYGEPEQKQLHIMGTGKVRNITALTNPSPEVSP